jgi:hypothetical protein
MKSVSDLPSYPFLKDEILPDASKVGITFEGGAFPITELDSHGTELLTTSFAKPYLDDAKHDVTTRQSGFMQYVSSSQ